MRILVAVKSCNRDMANGCHQAIRDTWGKDFPPNVDVRFFVGEYDNANEARLLTDEIRLHVVDDLVHLPIKVREMANWSLEQGYDYTYLCDVDTFVIPKRLRVSGSRLLMAFSASLRLGVMLVTPP